MISTLASERFDALGTGVVLVTTDPAALGPARATLDEHLARVDAACSRFRDDSELVALNRSGGRPFTMSPTLAGAVDVGLRVAAETGGVVDPTVGRAVRVLGYDRDFALLPDDGPPCVEVTTVPGWQAIRYDPVRGALTVPRGVELDLGATAKAWCADEAARDCAAVTGGGVLVSLGGDVAVAGPAPDGGWPVRISDRFDDPPEIGGPVVTIAAGGLATSSTTRRHWKRGGRTMHHLIDPATAEPAESCWRTVTVSASSCVGANAASTASIVLGGGAVAWLEERGLPARLVRRDGSVVTTTGWPVEAGA